MPRGRPKKNIETEALSEKQVWEVLDFAKSMSSVYQNLYTPDMVNSRMKDINMNPLQATADDIDKALLNPNSNEVQLKGYSEFFELTNMLYKRMLGYIALMPSFDYTFTCTNAVTEADYKSNSYQKDLKLVYDFLDKFDVKREFKKVMKQLLRQETYYSVLRTDGDKYIFQELPSKYCKITGKSEWGYLFDFNMIYFLNNPGVSIDMYPSVFKKMYKSAVVGNKNNGYNPAASIDKRNGDWILWTQTSPKDNFWSWKYSPEYATEVPYLSPLFSDVILAPMVRKLQTNKWMISAQKIAIGLIPMLKDNKSGNVRDMMSISPDTLGKFMGLLKNAIGDTIKFGSAPLEDIKMLDFSTTNDNIQEEFNKNVSSQSGINSRLIYGIDKPNALETKASIDVDEYINLVIYNQFNLFMDFQLNQLTKKFKFKFKFEGTEFSSNRATRFDNVMKLLDKGIVLPQKISASLGMDVADFERQLMQARAMGFVDKLTPIITAYTNSANNNGGRPTIVDDKKTDSAIATKESASNVEKGGGE